MRQWFGIAPSEMCSTHIKRELMETVQLVRVVRGEWDIPPETMVRKLAGHSARGQIDTSRIESRWTALVDELCHRSEELPSNCSVEPPEYPEVAPHFRGATGRERPENVEWLASKCDDCRSRLIGVSTP